MTLSSYNAGTLRATRSTPAQREIPGSARPTTFTSTWRRSRRTTTATPTSRRGFVRRPTRRSASCAPTAARACRDTATVTGSSNARICDHLDVFLRRPARRRCRVTRCDRAASSIRGGVVYPCITYSRPIGQPARHRHAPGADLEGREASARCSARSGGQVPAVLDRLRGVSEDSRQRPGRPLERRVCPLRAVDRRDGACT